MDAAVVRGSLHTAFEELKYARVRTYLPVIMERRAPAESPRQPAPPPYRPP
ncbi:three-helix bundle dimerization domain-containing protein [Streptomyces sp. NPDC086023]|uniref:three-helix bundle dimerization domain-containing protein n=1 Tax=Streptomyces sp. NPDC086023 TaxID=3365746 RepID=UPI0037CE3A0B